MIPVPTPPFLSQSLFDLARQVSILASQANLRTNDQATIKSNEALVTQVYQAMLVAIEKEAAGWDLAYAKHFLEEWDKTFGKPFNLVTAQRTEAGTLITEQAEKSFLDHGVRPWATPRGQAPVPEHQPNVFSWASKAFASHQYTLAHRLLDWPGGGAAFVEWHSAPTGRRGNASPFARSFPAGRTGWGGLVTTMTAEALNVLVACGAPLHKRDARGKPYLSYAVSSDVVNYLLAQGQDVLDLAHPFEQRKADLQTLIQGWRSPLSEHFLRSPGNGRREFIGLAYLEKRLAAWPTEERTDALMPWISSYVLKSEEDTALEEWAFRVSGHSSPQDLFGLTIYEGKEQWTFEQWCCVRFLRGHTNNPARFEKWLETLAQTFSPQPTAQRGTTTADLYALMAWCNPFKVQGNDPADDVPIQRLAPLLTRILAADLEPPAQHRTRLHVLMLALMDSPAIQNDPLIAPLMVAYAHWTCQNPTPHSDHATHGVLAWLTQPRHSAMLSPGDRHFVAINSMVSSIGFKPQIVDATWDLVAQSIAEGGHIEDNRTPALPTPNSGSWRVKSLDFYKNLVKAAALEEQLPLPAPKASKPRF